MGEIIKIYHIEKPFLFVDNLQSVTRNFNEGKPILEKRMEFFY